MKSEKLCLVANIYDNITDNIEHQRLSRADTLYNVQLDE